MAAKTNKTNTIKKALIESLTKSLGVVTTACNNAGVNRSTFYKYYNQDQKFKEQVDDILNVSLDFAESQLFKQIKDGNTAATIFYLKTKGKHRGFVEKTEQEITGQPFIVQTVKTYEVKPETDPGD